MLLTPTGFLALVQHLAPPYVQSDAVKNCWSTQAIAEGVFSDARIYFLVDDKDFWGWTKPAHANVLTWKATRGSSGTDWDATVMWSAGVQHVSSSGPAVFFQGKKTGQMSAFSIASP
jgi:hypothetical protein